jgi:HAD superfamily hydrolase (TIGR01450 family)
LTADPQVRGVTLGACDRPLVERYDVGLLDLDGVLYLGDQPIQHASASVHAAREAGMQAAFVTNNASRRPAAIAAHLTELGIPAQPPDVVTSAQAAVRLLRGRVGSGAAVLVLGSAGLAEEVELGGFRPVRSADGADGAVAAVVQGYDRDTGWTQLAEACVALRAGALWIATNVDNTLPSPRGPLPGNGAMVAALRTATGLEPLSAGKPEPPLLQESVERLAAQRPLVLGDRLDTDVLGAVRTGLDSLLVLTGVAALAEALLAPAGSRPTYISTDLRGLLEAHPVVEIEGETARCQAAVSTYADDRVTVQDDSVPALRAACALAWHCADIGLPVLGQA